MIDQLLRVVEHVLNLQETSVFVSGIHSFLFVFFKRESLRYLSNHLPNWSK